ncbi:excalibur calcium-binding domain-containing protein [Neisseria sp. Dent CA1/247]|uniref:excalibur calcium-binding domain-containing protein n=1 Tax=Neisseria sp. Dent CA1/247 TaxID=2912675 RepID=UPI001FD0A626|nr:excalibur calcium-binding domain-containing protein [Neisseria sp. Dent CA1/247]UOO77884.1 excalibur calcium-binding domain-containing protein [Neisseria sp. Dent CA1/247]
MRKLILLLAVAGGFWQLWGKDAYNQWQNKPEVLSNITKQLPLKLPSQQARKEKSGFTCDGRTRCSQMTSCEEAKFFLQNCPNTKMDGNHDGVPCESQWCR